MKWARICFLLEKPKYPNWIFDDKYHGFFVKESKFGSSLEVTKRPECRLEIEYKPWFGPKVRFKNVKIPDEVRASPGLTSLDLCIIWDTPHFKVLLDGYNQLEQEHTEISKAATVGISYSFYQKIKNIPLSEDKIKYELFRGIDKPEEDCYELQEVPRYLAYKYRLSESKKRENLKFLYEAKNESQKDRELLQTWNYGNFINYFCSSNDHITLVQPHEDRGVDSGIRIINLETQPIKKAFIPLQLADARIAPDGKKDTRLANNKINTTGFNDIQVNQIEDELFKIIMKAKGKPRVSENATLLVTLITSAPFKATDNAKLLFKNLRHLFSAEDNWPFEKIVIQSNTLVGTVFCQRPQDHFFAFTQNGKEYSFVPLEEKEGDSFTFAF